MAFIDQKGWDSPSEIPVFTSPGSQLLKYFSMCSRKKTSPLVKTGDGIKYNKQHSLPLQPKHQSYRVLELPRINRYSSILEIKTFALKLSQEGKGKEKKGKKQSKICNRGYRNQRLNSDQQRLNSDQQRSEVKKRKKVEMKVHPTMRRLEIRAKEKLNLVTEISILHCLGDRGSKKQLQNIRVFSLPRRK